MKWIIWNKDNAQFSNFRLSSSTQDSAGGGRAHYWQSTVRGLALVQRHQRHHLRWNDVRRISEWRQRFLSGKNRERLTYSTRRQTGLINKFWLRREIRAGRLCSNKTDDGNWLASSPPATLAPKTANREFTIECLTRPIGYRILLSLNRNRKKCWHTK